MGSSGGHPGPGQGGALSAHLPTLPAIQILALFQAPLEGGSWGVREATPPQVRQRLADTIRSGKSITPPPSPGLCRDHKPRSLESGAGTRALPQLQKANVTQPAACRWLPRGAPRSRSADRGSGRPAGPSPNRHWGGVPASGCPRAFVHLDLPSHLQKGRPAGSGLAPLRHPGRGQDPAPPHHPPDDPAQGSRQHQHQSPQMLEKRRLVRSARTSGLTTFPQDPTQIAQVHAATGHLLCPQSGIPRV